MFETLFLRGKGIKPNLNYSVKSFKFSTQSGLHPLASLFITSTERCNLCMIYA